MAKRMAEKPIAPNRGVNTANINSAKLIIANEAINNNECGNTTSIPKLMKKKRGKAIRKSKMRYFVTLEVSANPQLILPSEKAIPIVTCPIKNNGIEQLTKLNAAIFVLKLKNVRSDG